MADSVKIPVELDINKINGNLNNLRNTLNREVGNMVRSINQNLGNIGNRVNFNNITTASSRATQQVSNNFRTMSSTVNSSVSGVSINTNTAMNTVAASSTRTTSTIITGFRTAAANVLGTMGTALTSIGTSLTALGTKMVAVGASLSRWSLPIAAGLITAGKSAATFEESLAKISTVSDTTQVSMKEMSAGILDLSRKTGIGANDIANNVYDAISAGQSTADAVNFVSQSTKLAKAGFAEAGQSLDLLTTILNSYGLASSETARVNDVLIQVQNKGKVVVGELASVMGKVIPTANAYGVNLEQVGTAYAIMTSKGIKAAESTTYMQEMLKELGKSGTIASDNLKAATGKSFNDLIKSGKSLGEVLASLNKYAGKKGLNMGDMFGSGTAATAATILATNAGKDFNEMLKSMYNSAGSTDDAFEKVSATGMEKFRKALNELKISLIELGNKLLPFFTQLSEKLKEFIDKFNGLSDQQKTAILKIAAAFMLLGPALNIVGNLVKGVGGLSKMFGSLSLAIRGGMAASGATVATGAATMSTGLSLATRAVGLFLNPWIAIPAAVGLATYAVIKETKKIKKELETNLKNTNEVILGTGKALDELVPKIKNLNEKFNNMDIKVFNNDKQLKVNLDKTFEGILNYVETGVGDVRLLMNNLFKNLQIIAPNLDLDAKVEVANFMTSLLEGLGKAEDLSIPEITAFQDKMNKLLNIDTKININTDMLKVDYQIRDIFSEIDKSISSQKTPFVGFGLDFNTKKNNIVDTIEKQFSGLKGKSAEVVDITKVINGLTNSLDQSGMSADKQKKVFMELGEAIGTNLNTEQGLQLFNTLSEKFKMSSEDMNAFIENSFDNWDTLDNKQQDSLIKFISSIDQVKFKTQDLLDANFNTMSEITTDSSAGWANIVAEYLKGSDDVAGTLNNFSSNLVGTLQNMDNDARVAATGWISDFLINLRNEGGISELQVRSMADNINNALNSISGNTATISLDTVSADDKIQNIDQKLYEMTGKEYSSDILLDDFGFNTVMSDVESRIRAVDEAKPEAQVLADISNARNNLETIKQYIIYLKNNKDITITVSKNITETTTKKTVNVPVNSPQTFSLFKGVRDTLSDSMSNSLNPLLNITGFKEAEKKIDSKNIDKNNKTIAFKDKNKLTTIETMVNLDGEVIARVISDKIDVINGGRIIANNRRFAY